MTDYIDVQEVGNVMVMTLDDPTTRNSIGDEMATEINQEIDRLEASPILRALVITGRDPSFCSGANVKRMDSANQARANEPALPDDQSPWQYLEQQWGEMPENPEAGTEEIDGVRFVPLRLHELQKPSIAAVNGYAMGLGMGIALSCDIRIGSENARMAETFIRRGLIPADGSCWQLPRMIGLGNTMMLQYTGDPMSAEECYRLGIINKVTPHDELMETTLDLAQRIADGPTYSQALIKRLVQRSLNIGFAESLRLAGPAQTIARSTDDHKEGVRAFVEKRNPVFKGR
ncbi:MAG: enoyl-CoA hydratase-related protein [SAR202 cluster bacterium]|jgi:enoyl-CoA hydratase/carnithine racemase|nr:enoyl-CoA hydratase-related protein [SAR202 cluster bacterium]MDP6714342.1 enoyl-CoA hydratase-related protein [SAR202 cluster bacterium]